MNSFESPYKRTVKSTHTNFNTKHVTVNLKHLYQLDRNPSIDHLFQTARQMN